MTNLVSIAIPAYKDKYLSEAIESVLSQDYENIELVIVNDASPDDIDLIIDSYGDKRIRYYKNKKNLGKHGITNNWNKCLEYARGEYFVLLCDDDVLMPNFVSEMLKLVEKYPSCNVFHARKYIKHSNVNKLELEDMWPLFELGSDYCDHFFRGQRKHTVSEFLYRTDHIKKIKYQNFPVGFYSDNVSLMLFSKDGGIVSSQEPLMIFRESDIHISSNPKYNPGKALATRKFLRWAKSNQICKDNFDFHKNRIENESLSYLYGAQGWNKIKVIFCLPISQITIRGVIIHCKYLFRKKILRRS